MFFTGNVEAESFFVVEDEETMVVMEICFRDAAISPSHNSDLLWPAHNINALLLFAKFVDGRGTQLIRAMTFLKPTLP
uniref:Uncharacterized protein n=1 Tax=Nymphaea colorata TaxID=210225 RepID=A0A5K0ZM05_9MAGN